MIFDTDVLIWALRGSPQAARTIETAENRALSVVSFMELLQSARSKLEGDRIRQSLRRLGFEILPLSEPIGATAAAIIEQHALAHAIQLADALIAATAIQSGLTLYTGNVRHFRAIRNLSLKAFRP
jgi:predicted nucleic acid-binding protein